MAHGQERNFIHRCGDNVAKFWNWRLFRKHYLRPLLDRRKRIPYDPSTVYDRHYRASLADEGLRDSITIDAGTDPLEAAYHYAGIEMSIVEHFFYHGRPSHPAVLDIGTATGHWIDFYQRTFEARSIVGVDISATILDAAKARFESYPEIELVVDDISRKDFNLERKFEIINAIGVMFHIVEDEKWEQALENLAHHLTENGVIVVGGMFGLLTQDVNLFSSKDGRFTVVHKRIRSRARWRSAAKKAGCRLVEVRRTRRRDIVTRETNVGFLVRDRNSKIA